MLFIIGTSVKNVKNTLANKKDKSCPFCSEKMHLIDTKQYFSAFFIPLFSIKNIDSYYLCSNCNYRINITN